MALIRINENLTFDSINRMLMSDQLPDRKKPLGLAAAFCLECLIDAQGEIVSQERLIHEGWQKHGFEVSPGNVRQVVSQLRKAFSSLKESPDLLITVPKMGYRLKIHPAENEAPLLTSATTGELSEPDNAEKRSPSPSVLPHQNDTLRLRRKRLALYFLSAFLVGCSVLAAVGYFMPFILNAPLKINYQIVNAPTFPDKKILVDSRFSGDRSFIDSNLALLAKSPLWKEDSTRYDWIYLNGNSSTKVHSFFLCDREVRETPLNCVNRIFIEE